MCGVEFSHSRSYFHFFPNFDLSLNVRVFYVDLLPRIHSLSQLGGQESKSYFAFTLVPVGSFGIGLILSRLGFSKTEQCPDLSHHWTQGALIPIQHPKYPSATGNSSHGRICMYSVWCSVDWSGSKMSRSFFLVCLRRARLSLCLFLY